LFTDLGNVQRIAYELHLATVTMLEERSGREGVQLQIDLLSDELGRASAAAQHSASMSLGLGKLRSILAEYNVLLANVDHDISLLDDPATGAQLLDVVERFERTAQSLYDREETRFFQRVDDSLDRQRTSIVLLLTMGVIAAVFATLLLLSLNRSIGYEFERAYNMLETLYRADEELHRNVSLDQVGNALAAAGIEILHASKAVLFTWDDAHERLVPRVWRGFGPQIAQQTYAESDGCIAEVVQSGRIVVVEDTLRDRSTIQPLTIEEHVRAITHVPISIREQSFGILTICFGRPRSVDNDERRLLSALARRAASAIENARLYGLAQESAATQERQRLARELHDAVTQTLFAASLIAEVLPRIWDRSPDEGRARLEELRVLTRGALAEMRTLLLELRPQALLEADVAELLKQLADATTGRSRLAITVNAQPGIVMPPEAKVACYRIAQEALNNVVKHAHAQHATVSLVHEGDDLVLTVSDDGNGFDPQNIPSARLGLGIMRERALQAGASLQVTSAIGKGTCVMARWRHEEKVDG